MKTLFRFRVLGVGFRGLERCFLMFRVLGQVVLAQDPDRFCGTPGFVHDP